MKTIWIDRVRVKRTNNWGGAPRTSYYNYTVHAVEEGGRPSADTCLKDFDGSDHSDAVTLGRAYEHAKRLAAIGDDVPVKLAWEQGIINFIVTTRTRIVARDAADAEEQYRALFNIHNSAVHLTVEEG